MLTDDFLARRPPSKALPGSHTFLEHSRGHGKGKRGALSFPSVQKIVSVQVAIFWGQGLDSRFDNVFLV